MHRELQDLVSHRAFEADRQRQIQQASALKAQDATSARDGAAAEAARIARDMAAARKNTNHLPLLVMYGSVLTHCRDCRRGWLGWFAGRCRVAGGDSEDEPEGPQGRTGRTEGSDQHGCDLPTTVDTLVRSF